jgi:DNA-binding PadR family transcriptional regulator
MSLLALLAEGPSYGLQLKQAFEERTGGIWPLNVGQVYTTLDRLERDGLVAPDGSTGSQKRFAITAAGRDLLTAWFAEGSAPSAPARDELVLKLVMALDQPSLDPAAVIQAERKRAVQELQSFTRLKSNDPYPALGWSFLLDSLIFRTEARIRWLDACEARLVRVGTAPAATARTRERTTAPEPIPDRSEVLR